MTTDEFVDDFDVYDFYDFYDFDVDDPSEDFDAEAAEENHRLLLAKERGLEEDIRLTSTIERHGSWRSLVSVSWARRRVVGRGAVGTAAPRGVRPTRERAAAAAPRPAALRVSAPARIRAMT